MSAKFSVSSLFTIFPSSVGTSCLCSFSMYLLSKIVVIVGEYVLGLPIPFSSNAFTRLASVYLAGGVKAAAGGIAAAVFFGYLASLISKPKMKKQ